LRKCHGAFLRGERDEDVTKQTFIDARIEFAMLQQVIGTDASR